MSKGIFESTGNLLPDIRDPRTWRNLTVWAGVPGAVSFLVSRLTGKTFTEKEAKEFEKSIREAVKAENPEISLDPDITDKEIEKLLTELSILKQDKKTPLWVTLKNKLKNFVAGANEKHNGPEQESVRKTSDAEEEGQGPEQVQIKKPGDSGRFPVPSSRMITGDLEPGILAALAWLSILKGWELGRRTSTKRILELEKEKTEELENELEQAEYYRMLYLHDPKKFRETLKKRMDSLPKAAMIDSIVMYDKYDESKVVRQFLKRVAQEDKSMWQTIKDALFKGVKVTGQAAEIVYPSIFLALLLGGFSIGNYYAKKIDPHRQRKKIIQSLIEQDLLENQTPTILNLTSDKPWERAKHLPPEEVNDLTVPLPEDIEVKAAREAREIRI